MQCNNFERSSTQRKVCNYLASACVSLVELCNRANDHLHYATHEQNQEQNIIHTKEIIISHRVPFQLKLFNFFLSGLVPMRKNLTYLVYLEENYTDPEVYGA